MNLRKLHALSAIFVTAFVCLHIANHLVALAGASSHITFMEAARVVYRQPAVELAILFAVAFQIPSGLSFVVRGWRKRHGLVPWLQAISGAYLAVFLIIHVSAILFGRTVLHLDTNFYYAAAGFHVEPYQLFFAPYYFLAVVALFIHLGCAAYRQTQSYSPFVRTLTVIIPSAIGLVASLLIVFALAGNLVPFEVPAKYKATYALQDR